MNVTLDTVKALIPILTVFAFLVGFYYKTQYRLEQIEEEIEELRVEVESAKKMARKANKDSK